MKSFVQKSKETNMGLIALEGMRFYAHHGIYEEEKIIGNNFEVNIYITTNYAKASATDDIQNTINYETVYLICQAEMRKPTQLIEAIALKVIRSLKHQFDTLQKVKIQIIKENPLPGSKVAHSMVEEEHSFVSKCPRCGTGFVSYKDDTCWCQNVNVHPKTREAIKQEFRGCLCAQCLSFYAG